MNGKFVIPYSHLNSDVKKIENIMNLIRDDVFL